MNTKEQASQLRLAADILETGHPWEYRTRKDSEWASSSAISPTYVFTYQQGEIRIILATPPDNRPLHNPDKLTAEQVGVGYRLTLAGELDSQPGQQYWSSGEWHGNWIYKVSSRLPLSVPWPALPEPEFQLPTPPPGIEWHCKNGWKAGDLPQGYRPLAAREVIRSGDEFWADPWLAFTGASIGEAEISGPSSKYRTTRPLTFTHLGKTWTWHKAGDPMPCGGEQKVSLLLQDLRIGATALARQLYWDADVTEACQIIGWRYAETEPSTKTVDLGPEDVPPGSAVRGQGSSCWWSALNVDSYGITFCDEVRGRWSWQQLRAAYEINRSSPLTGKWNPDAWEPCHKQIPV